MTASALFMGLLGLSVTFLPQEILHYMGINPSVMPLLFMQILGALWMGFAMLNWMCKEILIGGIYGRPVAVANLMHFMVGALALLKGGFKNADMPLIWIAFAFYSLFSVGFALVLFTNPSKKQDL
jgi:hypothetical protein